jgi:hypothetical protein
MKDKQVQYTMSIIQAVDALFDEDSELKRYDFKSLDATKFFTAYIIAGNFIFNKFTGNNKNNLEFTHLANQLIVQNLLDEKE